MRIRVQALPITGQAWIDTVDYHVRAAVEAAGLRLESWSTGEGFVESPDLSDAEGQRAVAALRDIPLVKVIVLP